MQAGRIKQLKFDTNGRTKVINTQTASKAKASFKMFFIYHILT